MIKGVYVLESEWVFDGVNRELATFTVEKHHPGYEELSVETIEGSSHLHDVAATQNGNPMGTVRLIRLYKIKNMPNGLAHFSLSDRSPRLLYLELEPIFEFDVNGKAWKVEKLTKPKPLLYSGPMR